MSKRMTLSTARDVSGSLGGSKSLVAEAVRTIVKVGEVLGRLDREHDTVAASNPRPGRDEYTAGYLAGIDTAHTWLQKTLEDHHE